MTEEYKFKTLQDIYTQLPDADTIGACLDELKTAMMGAKVMGELVKASAEAVGEKVHLETQWPETSTWINDGKSEVELKYLKEGDAEPMMSVKFS